MQINRLIQALDPRGFSVYASNSSSEEERMRPFLWRFWIKTPANGRIAIFDRSWYRSVQADRFDGITKEEDLAGAYQDILSFEKQPDRRRHGDHQNCSSTFPKEEQKKAVPEAGRFQGNFLAE